MKKRIIIAVFILLQLIGATYATVQGTKNKIIAEQHNSHYILMYKLMIEENK